MQNLPQEKEWAGSILYQLKMECTSLCTAALECADPNLRNHFKGLLNKSLENQQKLFELMNKRGWYKTEPAPEQQVSMMQQSFTSMQNQMQSQQSMQ